MRYLLAGAALFCLPSAVHAAPVAERNDPAGEQQQQDWLDSVASVDLTAVDGSRLRFTLDDNGMTRHIVASDGGEQATAFVFLNHDLGTVRDGDGDVTGFFRRTPGGLEVTYADGRLESVALLDGGGVTMILHAPGNADVCMGWYPKGHAFSEGEKRAALAHYAQQLGVALPGGDVANSGSCPKAQDTAVADAPPTPPRPLAKPSAPARRSRHNVPVEPASALAPLRTDALPALTRVAVRTSEVHMVPAAPDSPDPINGASSCLAVDSDGGHWGFRNHCEYDVEFAFCLKNAGSDAASCDKGARSGLVTANGFTPLVKAGALGGNAAERQFRWVGCGLTDGALEAHLDQTSPPAGRCVRPS